MDAHQPDPPELAKAINMLREIYWREYGRGWREATQRIKDILEREAKAAAKQIKRLAEMPITSQKRGEK